MPAGQPTKYKKKYVEQVEKLCATFGADDKKLAEFYEVCEDTIHNWKKKYPKFFESIKKGKDIYDTENVEKSLLRRALGYSYKEETLEQTEDAKGKTTKKNKTVGKHMPPDTTAQIFWLKNRNKKRWKDIKAIAQTGSDDEDKAFLTLQEWRKANAVEKI